MFIKFKIKVLVVYVKLFFHIRYIPNLGIAIKIRLDIIKKNFIWTLFRWYFAS